MYLNPWVQVGDEVTLLVNLCSFIKKIFRVKPRLVIATFTFYQAWFSKVSAVFHCPQWIFWGGENDLSEQVFVHHVASPSIFTSKLRPFMSPSF